MTDRDRDRDALSNGPRPTPEAPRWSLARLLHPLRAELTTTASGMGTTAVDPLPAAAAVGVLADLETGPDAELLLVGDGSGGDATSLSAMASRLGLRPGSEATHLVVPAERIGALEEPFPVAFVAVLVDGPIEPRDVTAIAVARSMSVPVLDAELRAVAAVRIDGGSVAWAETRTAMDGAAFVAEGLRRYVATLRDVPPAAVARPEPRLVERILERSGTVLVRPLETEVFSTAVDIGIATTPGASGGADTSLIYDLYANAWYGD